jgi:transposase
MILVNEIQRLYDEYGSISRVSRELKISRNTVRKYLHRIQEVRNGFQEELVFDLQKPRPKRIVTPQLIEFVHRKLDENKSKPRKQRLSALDIHRLAQASGHQVGYSSVKKLVYEWKQSNDTRDIYVLQDPPEGHRAEFVGIR